MDRQSLNKRYLTITATSCLVTAILMFGTLAIGGYNIFKFQLGAAELIDFAPSLIFVVLALALVAVLNLLWFRNSIVKPLTSIENVISSVRKGNYNDRIKIETKSDTEGRGDTRRLWLAR